MARGWESKAVEAQQDAALARRPSPGSDNRAPQAQQRATLELALARARADLQRATHDAYRRSLEAAIAALGERLRNLGP